MSGLDARAMHVYSYVALLRTGTTVIASVLAGLSVIRFAFFAGDYPRLAFGVAAMVMLLAVVVMLWVVPPPREMPMARWHMATYLSVCGLIIALDVAGTWHPGTTMVFPATCVGVGGLLFATVTTLPPRDTLLAAGVFGLALFVLLGVQARSWQEWASCLSFVVLVWLPPLIGVVLVRGFRSIVQFHSEIAQTSSVTATDSAVGMLASEELARLDAAAERLLDDVAEGREPLPLDEDTAERASSLATQLRLRLVDDRRQTWLNQAVTESAVLDPVTVVEDPEGLAASLSARQRDGLFSAIWLLVGSAPSPSMSLRIHVSRGFGAGPQPYALRVVLEVAGLSRRRIDPGTWQAIRRVGRFAESGGSAPVRIEIDCLVDASSGR